LYPDCRICDVGYTCQSQAAPADDSYEVYDMMAEVHPDGRPAFPHDPDLSWRSMQPCDPPITVADLLAYCGADIWKKTDTYATLFDRDGITMGWAYDTAAAMFRSSLGKQDPRDAWWFHVTFGINSLWTQTNEKQERKGKEEKTYTKERKWQNSRQEPWCSANSATRAAVMSGNEIPKQRSSGSRSHTVAWRWKSSERRAPRGRRRRKPKNMRKPTKPPRKARPLSAAEAQQQHRNVISVD
jgi:hypothetical protein